MSDYLTPDVVALARTCLGRRVSLMEFHRDATDQAWLLLRFDDGSTVQIALADDTRPVIEDRGSTVH